MTPEQRTRRYQVATLVVNILTLVILTATILKSDCTLVRVVDQHGNELARWP